MELSENKTWSKRVLTWSKFTLRIPNFSEFLRYAYNNFKCISKVVLHDAIFLQLELFKLKIIYVIK